MNLKYIKLFEAFKSNKLSKTLSYIDENSKKEFLNDIKQLSDYLDFPESELSDDYFKYLSFNKAFKMKPDEDKSLIKFWFSEDGKYINKTITNKETLERLGFSYNFDNYEEVEEMNVNELNHGDIVKYYNSNIQINTDYTIGMIYCEDDRYYLINNKLNGAEPFQFQWQATQHQLWKKYGDYSWKLSSGEKVILLRKKKEEKLYPYKYNLKFYIEDNNILDHFSEINFKNAHFSLILDIDNIDKKISKSEIIKKRIDNKKGALALKSDEEIRSANIERFIKKLNSSATTDISDLNKLIKRIIKKEFALFGVNKNSVFLLKELIETYFSFMKAIYNKNDKEILGYKSIIKDIIYDINENFLKNNNKEVIDYLKKEIPKENLFILEELIKLSNIIYDKINSYKIESLDDFEVIYRKIKTIQDLKLSQRYELYELQYFFNCFIYNKISNYQKRNALYLIRDYKTNKNEFIESIQKLSNIIKKL